MAIVTEMELPVHVFRHKFPEAEYFGWCRTWVEHGDSFWIKSYDHPPASQEIEFFLNKNDWWPPERFKILDAEICARAWKKVIGQEPILEMPFQSDKQSYAGGAELNSQHMDYQIAQAPFQ